MPVRLRLAGMPACRRLHRVARPRQVGAHACCRPDRACRDSRTRLPSRALLVLGIAIDIGGGHVTCALVDDHEVRRKETAALREARLNPTLVVLEEMTRRLLNEERAAASDCAGVSLAFCGVVDDDRGCVLATLDEKFEDALDCDLPAWSEQTFGLPLRLENDARLALLGEAWCGAATGFDDIVMVTLGTGIGGAAMIGGQL